MTEPVRGGVPARLTVATLGARDVPELAAFYKRLGWPVVFESGEFVCFELRGALLAVFGRDALAADAGTGPTATAKPGSGGFALAINTDERDDVDAVVGLVREAGGRITKEPVDAELFVGRSAYFADPEGNAWEVVWLSPDNPVALAVRRAAGLGD